MPATSMHRQVLSALAAQSINISVGLCQGYSAVLLPQYSLENPEISFEQSSWIASLGVISNPIGALLGGVIADAVGRRLLLLSIVLPNLIGWLVITFSESYEILCLGRFISGFTIGMSITAYIYVTEVTTPKKRGLLNAVGPTLVSTGILVADVLGAFINWRAISAVCAAVSLLAPVLMYFVPESPLWLASKGHITKAQNALAWFGRDETTQNELMEHAKDKSECLNFRQKLFLAKKKFVLKAFLILTVFFLFQQLSGIYILLFYLVNFFQKVHTGLNKYYAAIIVGGGRLVMGSIGALLINNFSRKTLAQTSGFLLGATMLAAAVCVSLNGPPLITLVCVLLNVSFSMIGFLQLPWIMSSELYPQDIRGVMSGITLCCAYSLIFLSVKTYPEIEGLMTTTGTLYFFSISSIIGAIYCMLFLPETKDKSLDEIILNLEGVEISDIKPDKKPIERKQNTDDLAATSKDNKIETAKV